MSERIQWAMALHDFFAGRGDDVTVVSPDDPDASHVDRKACDVFFVTLGQPTSQLMPKKPAPLDGQKCAAPA
jgi:hypothetical protein